MFWRDESRIRLGLITISLPSFNTSIPTTRIGVEDRIAQRIGIRMVAVGNFVEAFVSSPAECCKDAGGEPVLMRQTAAQVARNALHLKVPERRNFTPPRWNSEAIAHGHKGVRHH